MEEIENLFKSTNSVMETNFKCFKAISDHIAFNLHMVSEGAEKRRGTKRYFDAAIRSGYESDKIRCVNLTFDNTTSELSLSLVHGTNKVEASRMYQMEKFDTTMLTEIKMATRAWICDSDVTI